ncbi:MAG: hypothetical protein GY913_29170 [Proteobacteria bacterium]|nr:hypothetical protein [Pseudomonadota bacterium]
MWTFLLAHHGRDDRHRCVHIGPLVLCRRCTATWPVAAALILAGMAGRLPLAADWELALWLGPPTGEYLAVHTARTPYRSGRTWLFGILLGIGLGRTFHRYLADPMDPVVWAVLGTIAVVWGGAAAAYHLIVKKRLV